MSCDSVSSLFLGHGTALSDHKKLPSVSTITFRFCHDKIIDSDEKTQLKQTNILYAIKHIDCENQILIRDMEGLTLMFTYLLHILDPK